MSVERTWMALLALLGSLALFPGRASAHDVHGEVVFLDLGEQSVAIEIQVPLSQLHAAAPELYSSNARVVSDVRLELVPEYVRTRFTAYDRAHRPFVTTVQSVAVQRVGDGDVLLVKGLLRPSGATDARWFELHDEVILQRLVTHSVYVFLRTDLRAGAFGDKPSLLGELHYQNHALVVDRSAGSRWNVFRQVFALGTHHIAEGADHLLFLFMLLLPAPLLAIRGAGAGWRRRRAWQPQGTIRKAVLETAKIVTAFTLGHSLTLAASAFLNLSASARPSAGIEVAIAVSILVSAVHALRPLFPGREALVAGSFGLVHGLAFASALSAFGFDRTTLALSVLGFNLGVEAMQLTIVLLTVPLLAILSRGAGCAPFRLAGGAFGGLAALGWIAERAFGVATPTSAWVAALAARGPWLMGGLLIMTIVDVLLRREKTASA